MHKPLKKKQMAEEPNRHEDSCEAAETRFDRNSFKDRMKQKSQRNTEGTQTETKPPKRRLVYSKNPREAFDRSKYTPEIKKFSGVEIQIFHRDNKKILEKPKPKEETPQYLYFRRSETAKEREIRKWALEHKDFMKRLEQYIYDIDVLHLDGPGKTVDGPFIDRLLYKRGFAGLGFTGEDLLAYWGKQSTFGKR